MDFMEAMKLRAELSRLIDDETELRRRIVDLAKRAEAAGDKFTLDRAIDMFERLTGRDVQTVADRLEKDLPNAVGGD